jgi:hypothetical protein
MNLFFLDHDLDKCAEYHIDKHVGKMQLEAAQLMSTTLWVDKLFGFVPRKLDADQLSELRLAMSSEPVIEERKFLRYLATHPNHPCAVWVRSSLDNFIWTHCYVNALNSESVWRGNKPHASCVEVNKMPEPLSLPSLGLTAFALAMPDEYKTADAVISYRTYYKNDKANIASWKRREQPEWWNDY